MNQRLNEENRSGYLLESMNRRGRNTPAQAKALYDNIAETPEELAFRRGDILSVIEQDASGLQGWWLCSIKGRRGIVPGNRLRLLDKSLAGDGDTAVDSNGHRVKTDHAAVTEALRTWHQQHRVVTPKKHGSTFVYDVPQRAIADARNTDYDVPPSRSPNTVSRSSSKLLPRPSECDYDHPTARGGATEPKQMDPSQLLQVQMSTLDHCDVPGSNRSSTISVMSTGSSLSAVSSGSCAHSSVCESGRSSLDMSAQDMYDVPPAARALNAVPGTRASKPNDPTYDTPKPHPKYAPKTSQNTQDAMNDYDVLKSCGGGNVYNTPRKDSSLTYDTPKLSKPVSRNCSGDSGISLAMKNNHVYDLPNYNLAAHQACDSPRILGVKPSEDAEYDTPRPSRMASPSPARLGTPMSGETVRTGTPVSGDSVSVYDVPPRVTKDTGESLTIKEDIKRASSGSSDSDIGPFPYDELRMELGAAMECLVGLQHCINKSCSKLLAFVHPNWRTQQSLEPRVYEVKLSTVAVRKAAELFLEFAQGALVNASKSEDRKLTNRLCKAVDTLGEGVQTFNQCLDNLNKDMWPLVTLVRSQDSQNNTEDNLDTVVRVAKELPEYIRSISGLIQGNSMHLFKRSGSQANTTTQPGSSTPQSKVKSPPPTMPKPRVSITSPECGVPMPKFVPKSPDVASDSPHEHAERPLSDICKTVSESTDKDIPESDYDVPKPLANSEVQNNNVGPQGTEKNSMDEYDYVSLTKKPDCSAGKEKTIEAEDCSTVEMREKAEKFCDNDNNPKQGSSGRARVVQSLFPPPDIRTSGLSESFKDRLEKLQKEAEEPVKIYSEDYDVPQSHAAERASSRSQTINAGALHGNDRLILQFYATQVDTHSNILVNAIEAFLKCIEEHQSPKTFIAYSKFVILAAHKIVYIGDTLTRHLLNDNIRNDVMNHAYTLCELLKDTVTATKKAALEYPGITYVQDMVDRVSEVSVAANGLKQIIIRFAS